jgi:hypothetical protein
MSDEKTKDEHREPPRFQPKWILGFIAVWILIGISPMLAKEPGPFGDMFGMVNSLFSGAALLGLIYTIRLQMHEIYLQREELKQTRDELKKSADAQKDSAQALALQVLISAITAQLSTHISRRETAFANLRRLEDQPLESGVLNPRQVLEKKKEPLNEAVSYLTAEIETLQKRLSEYDKELSSKLVETQKPAE